MSDDLHLLRRGLADLSELGGNADLYDGVLDASRRLGRRRRLLSSAGVVVAVLAVGVPVALADRHVAGPPEHPDVVAVTPSPTVSPSPTPSSVTPPSSPPTQNRTQHPKSTHSSDNAQGTAGRPTDEASLAPDPVDDGCPVGPKTLKAALEGSAVGEALAPSKKLSDIVCYSGYAIADSTPEDPHADGATVVFRYNAESGTWKAIAGGTADYCDDVPAKVRPHLERC